MNPIMRRYENVKPLPPLSDSRLAQVEDYSIGQEQGGVLPSVKVFKQKLELLRNFNDDSLQLQQQKDHE